MRNVRFLSKRISVWIILFLQVLLITSYFLLQTDNAKHQDESSVSFIAKNYVKYYFELDLYADFNISVCYKPGSDLNLMKRSKSLNWECKCLPDWHGNDCAQPEVIWRALLSTRMPLSIKGPRKSLRRIIYLFEVNEYTEAITEIRLHELNSLIDLFVMYEEKNNIIFEKKLQKGFLKDFHHKILYLQFSKAKHIWLNVKKIITNLNEDDIVLIGGLNDIPNGLALQYLKLYDKWPQPLLFRLRWSVYGFFWLHPNKTILKPGACTVSYLFESLNDNLELLNNQKRDHLGKSLIIGDLNHFGGWQCEYCYESHQILKALESLVIKRQIQYKSVDKLKIDNAYVEDLIENGIYVDDTTALLRTHRNQENYFAPPYVRDNHWKYDWLLINLYSKMDYY
ncbi:hypothetical protein FQR65_LT07518 [Abscondita terminalis]|nr:hypothetical protein FQR65_LT07518 [Abscondita terminalis]